MAVRGPKARALALDLADTATFAATPDDSRAEIIRMAAEFRAIRDLELALHVPVVGDAVSRSWHPPTRTLLRCERRTRCWLFQVTRRRQSRKS